MTTPTVTELSRRLEPVCAGTFIEGSASAAPRPARDPAKSEPSASAPSSVTRSPAGRRRRAPVRGSSSDPAADLVALVSAARTADDGAWARLVARFDRQLRSIAVSYGLSAADVDDAVQATWLLLFRNIERVREPAAVAGWLATTVRRECLRLLQRPVREQLSDDPHLGDRADVDGPEEQLFAAERRAVLGDALAVLPDRHRRLMMLLATDPAPDYEHISISLDMPRGSIGPIRARCLARLARNPELRTLRASYADDA